MPDISNDNSKNDTNGKNIFNIDRINRNDSNNIDTKNEFNSLFLTKEELLARDLAAGLDDETNLAFYLSVCRRYPEEFLRRTYSQVKQVPEKKIKKSRGALFNYLVQKYDKNNS